MWHNPRLMNLWANAFFSAAGFIVFCLLIVAAFNSSLFPLRTLQVRGELKHVDPDVLRLALQDRVSGNFFGADLRAVRNAAQNVPWVRSAQVRREWPDRLVLTLEEHVPLARWSDSRLVNSHGEVYEGRVTESLPDFRGPEGAAARMTERYREFDRLAQSLELSVVRLDLTARHAWELRLVDENRSLHLVLGKDQIGDSAAQRLERFVAVYPQAIAPLERRNLAVDLRYPNGFAVRLPGLELKQGGSA